VGSEALYIYRNREREKGERGRESVIKEM